METGERCSGCIDVLSSCGGKYCDVLSWKRVYGVVVVLMCCQVVVVSIAMCCHGNGCKVQWLY